MQMLRSHVYQALVGTGEQICLAQMESELGKNKVKKLRALKACI